MKHGWTRSQGEAQGGRGGDGWSRKSQGQGELRSKRRRRCNSPTCPQAERPAPNGSGHVISVKMTASVNVCLRKNRVVEMRVPQTKQEASVAMRREGRSVIVWQVTLFNLVPH